MLKETKIKAKAALVTEKNAIPLLEDLRAEGFDAFVSIERICYPEGEATQETVLVVKAPDYYEENLIFPLDGSYYLVVVYGAVLKVPKEDFEKEVKV